MSSDQPEICSHLYDGPERNGWICRLCNKIINNQAADDVIIRYSFTADWLPKTAPSFVMYEKDEESKD